ncbi:Uncharacterized protein PBTT_10324 [Plasmodiophora brassicae]
MASSLRASVVAWARKSIGQQRLAVSPGYRTGVARRSLSWSPQKLNEMHLWSVEQEMKMNREKMAAFQAQLKVPFNEWTQEDKVRFGDNKELAMNVLITLKNGYRILLKERDALKKIVADKEYYAHLTAEDVPPPRLADEAKY